MERRRVGIGLWGATLALLVGAGVVRPADELAEVRQFIPAGAQVLFHVQANVDDTPGKEWIIQYKLVPPGESDTWPAGYTHLLILCERDGEWRKVFSHEQLDELEFRDLDGDRVLEVIIWCHDEGNWGFSVLDFQDGRFRLLPGLAFGYPTSHRQGLIDLEGDGPLELIATGQLPGYLAAMAPEEATPLPGPKANGPGHLDVRFYRLAHDHFVLYFPAPSAVVHGLGAGLASGYDDTLFAATEAAGILGVEACVPRLLELLHEPTEGVAATAVTALGRIRTPEAIEGVLQAVQDRRGGVVLAAADALCDIDDPRATEALLAVRNHPFPEVRDAVARKLNKTQTGDPQGAAVETEPETEPEEPSEPSVPYLIAELGEDATVPRLEAIFREHEAFGLAVVEALVAVRTAEAIAALRNLGRTSHVETSAAATLALIDLGVPDAFDLLLELSRSGNHEAKRRLLGMTGEAVEQELTRSLAEDAPPPDVSIWGDLYCADYETGYVPGWFTAVSERLGDAALPILVSRVERTLPSRLDTGAQPGEGDCAAAVAAAHLLRERGVVEAIPLLQEMSATHATTEGREVATWSLVSLRRKAAGASGPLFPAD